MRWPAVSEPKTARVAETAADEQAVVTPGEPLSRRPWIWQRPPYERVPEDLPDESGKNVSLAIIELTTDTDRTARESGRTVPEDGNKETVR